MGLNPVQRVMTNITWFGTTYSYSPGFNGNRSY